MRWEDADRVAAELRAGAPEKVVRVTRVEDGAPEPYGWAVEIERDGRTSSYTLVRAVRESADRAAMVRALPLVTLGPDLHRYHERRLTLYRTLAEAAAQYEDPRERALFSEVTDDRMLHWGWSLTDAIAYAHRAVRQRETGRS
jgi:hypothetical protein